MDITYQEILQADLPELIALESQILDATRPPAAYRAVLIAYLRGNVEALRREMELDRLSPEFAAIARIRLSILHGLELEKETDIARKALAEIQSREALAEMNFCLAIASIKIGEFNAASRDALLSERGFLELRLSKKAVKARFNSLIAQTHLFPNSRFYADYRSLAVQAGECGEWAVQVAANLNIAREFQKIGALIESLEFASNAIEAAERLGEASREHGFALLQRADVLMKLGRRIEANRDLAIAALVDHPEVQSAIKTLLQEQSKPDDEVHKLARFREPAETSKPLGTMEERLVSLLNKQPQDFNDLSEKLFPEVIDVFSQRERLKNLIARVRKKNPGLIVRETGRYRLSREMRKV